MNTKKVLLAVAVAAAACVCSENAQAQNACWGGFAPWYTGYTREYVPYYAMHPPVYYSYPVPRAYGWSPWAYPPGVLTPEILSEGGGPKEMINPHLHAPSNEKPTSTTNQSVEAQQRKAPVPQVVINPFVGTHLASQ
jgi:hypothetical protein